MIKSQELEERIESELTASARRQAMAASAGLSTKLQQWTVEVAVALEQDNQADAAVVAGQVTAVRRQELAASVGDRALDLPQPE